MSPTCENFAKALLLLSLLELHYAHDEHSGKIPKNGKRERKLEEHFWR